MTSQPRAVILVAAASIVVALAGAGVAIGRAASHQDNTPIVTSGVVPSPAVTATATAPATATASPAATPRAHSQSTQHLQSLLATALRKALAQHTVHSAAREVSAHGQTTTFDNYDGVSDGTQTIGINGGHLDVRVVGTTTYLNGDAKGLAVYHIDSRTLGGKWLMLVAGQSGYQDITAGVTIGSALQADTISGPLSSEPTKRINGEDAFGITGRGTGANSPHGARATMWISATTGLPVEFDAVTRGTTITVTFTDWGTPIHVTAPTNVYGQQTLSG